MIEARGLTKRFGPVAAVHGLTFSVWPGEVTVHAADRSGPRAPEPDAVGQDAEGGRGLQLVAGLAARWGWRRRGGRIVTWFEVQGS